MKFEKLLEIRDVEKFFEALNTAVDEAAENAKTTEFRMIRNDKQVRIVISPLVGVQ